MKRSGFSKAVLPILIAFVLFGGSALAKPYILIENLNLTRVAQGTRISGTVVAGGLKSYFSFKDRVSIFAELPESRSFIYPALAQYKDPETGCLMADGACLSERQLEGVNVMVFKLYDSVIREAWRKGYNWQINIPDVIRRRFSAVIPTRYGRVARIHAILKRTVRRGLEGDYIRYYHWLKVVDLRRVTAGGYTGSYATQKGACFKLKERLARALNRIRRLEKRLSECRGRLLGYYASKGFEFETDRPGMDYRHFKIETRDPALCADACNRDARCKAWTFKIKSSHSGVCWLKYGVPAPVRNGACVSGVKKLTGYRKGRYLGCFKDKGAPEGLSGRDLNGYMFESDHSMTPSLCISVCRKRGFMFAGLQYSKQCFCGNSYGRYGRSNNCNMRCSGDKQKICGGSWANSVYATGLKRPVFIALKKVVFYGRQRLDKLTGNLISEGNTLVVKRRAKIVGYSSSGGGFCIYRESRMEPVACSDTAFLDGFVLTPGRYWIMPHTTGTSNGAWAKVEVKCRQCYVE